MILFFSHAMIGEFVEKLLENNLSEEYVKIILGKNVLRVIEKSIGYFMEIIKQNFEKFI